MAVTVTTHSQAGVWTAAQLRSVFEASFIANGIMTAWYDSFTSGSCELGVVQRVFNGAKAYGTTYYVFKFCTTGVYVYDCDSWNATTHVPDGTVHDTYANGYSFSNTSGGNGEYTFMNLSGTVAPTTSIVFGGTRYWTPSTSTQVTLRCFASAVNPDFKVFEFRNGTNYGSFIFPVAPASHIDLDTWLFNGLYTFCGNRSGQSTHSGLFFAAINNGPRRSIFGGASCGVDTSLSFNDAAYTSCIVANYTFVQSASASVTSNAGVCNTSSTRGIQLPVLRASQLNTPAPSDLYYIHTGFAYSPYESSPNVPSDFGIYYAQDGNTAVSNGDVLVVDPGVSEYEVLHALPAQAVGNGYLWGALVARVV